MHQFWERVDRGGSHGGCWLWLGSIDRDGYGKFHFDGKLWRAHRFAWRLHNGEIPDGLGVLHKCDRPPCVNPGCLFLGTNGDNNRDRDAKGRGKIAQPKLTGADVIEMHERRAQGETVVSLAKHFGVGRSTAGRVLLGKIYPIQQLTTIST